MSACSTPDAPVNVASVSVTPLVANVIVGNTLQLAATARDASGQTLSGRAVAWSTDNVANASISATGLLTAIAPGTVMVAATAGGQRGSALISVVPIPVASLTISPSTVSLVAGTTRQFVATPRDAAGNTLTGRVVTWSVSSATTGAIDATGLFTAIAPGSATITATSEGQTISASINVLPVPVATVTVTPPVASFAAGTTQQLAASTRDATGAVLTGRFVTWTSSATQIATVDGVGLVTAVAPGVVTISATSENRVGSSAITVTPGAGGPIVTAITPATLQPGTNVTITGVGFGNTNAANVVTVGGVVAPMVTSTESQLVIAVPCVANGDAVIRVVSNGAAGAPLTRLVATPQRTLAVGEALVVTNNAASVCNQLTNTTATARYLVAVFSASTSQAIQTDFELTGNTPLVATSSNAAALRVDPWRVPGASSSGAPATTGNTSRSFASSAATPFGASDEESARERVHFAFLERDRAQYEQLRARTARTSLTRLSRPAITSAALPAVGDMRAFYYTFTGGCGDTTRVVRGKAIYIGTRGIIWEDSANTIQSSVDENLAGYYQRLGQIFDQDQYESVRNNFGDPLVRDGVTDNDGRVHMIFSQRLNGSGAAAYVTSCDQFPRSSSAGSNFGQFFYGSVPTTSSLNVNATASPDGWFYFMARTVVHEVKHIASISARVANNAPSFEQSWLEEGTARHAEEMWVRESLHRVAWKANTGFGSASTNGVFCDFSPTDAVCNAGDPVRRPSYGMRRHFNEIREKLIAPWDYSPYGDAAGQSASTFYQTTWSLVRYTIDRYAASDAAFFRALVNATTNGATNLSAVAGVPMDQLIGGWGLSLFADDYPGIASPSADIQFPTWNLRSIYAGLNALPAWTTRWNTPFPIQPVQLGFGSFVAPRTGLRGGAHAYFEISGATAGAQLVGLRSGTVNPVSNLLRVAIVRLQ